MSTVDGSDTEQAEITEAIATTRTLTQGPVILQQSL